MTDPDRACSRCGSSSEPITTTLSVVSGVIRDQFPELNLCVWCSHSLVRWMERKRRGRHSSSSQGHHERSERPERAERRDELDRREPADALDDDEDSDEEVHDRPRSSSRRRSRSRSSKRSSSRRNDEGLASDDQSTWGRFIESPLFVYGALLLIAALILFIVFQSIRPAPDPTALNVK
jgi:hypothetical protein